MSSVDHLASQFTNSNNPEATITCKPELNNNKIPTTDNDTAINNHETHKTSNQKLQAPQISPPKRQNTEKNTE